MSQNISRSQGKIPFTKEGYDKMLEERNALLEERPHAVEDLQKAREMGDLSENGYYKAARAKLSSIDANLRRLERLRKLGVIISANTGGVVDLGTTVTLTDGEKEVEYTIVGAYESNPIKSTISHLSPLGKAMLGKKTGDTVEVKAPSGIKRYTIKQLH